MTIKLISTNNISIPNLLDIDRSNDIEMVNNNEF